MGACVYEPSYYPTYGPRNVGFNNYGPGVQVSQGFGGGPQVISLNNGPSYGHDFMGHSRMSPVYDVNMGMIPEVNTF